MGQVSALDDRLSWSDGISVRVDCHLVALDVFFSGTDVGDGDFLELVELVLGLSGMVEQEESEELLCFLEDEYNGGADTLNVILAAQIQKCRESIKYSTSLKIFCRK